MKEPKKGSFMLILFSKSEQFSLFDMPVHVAASVDKNGVVRQAHMSKRKKHLSKTSPTAHAGSKLDIFVAKHGGPAHLKTVLEGMTPEQRAKLIDAMAHLDGVGHEVVMEKLVMKPVEVVEPVVEPEVVVPTEPEPEPDDGIIHHITGKGKILRGIIRTDLTSDQAKAIDQYTFRKNGGWFIREKHLEVANKLDVAHEAEVITDDQHEAARAGAAQDGPAGAVAVLAPHIGHANKLRESADKIEQKAKEEIGRDRLANTPKRAGQAASAIAGAEKDVAIARTMHSLSDAIQSGEAKHLGGVKNAADVRMLDDALVAAMQRQDKGLSYTEAQARRDRHPEPVDVGHASIMMPKWSYASCNPNRLLELLKGKRGVTELANDIRYSRPITTDFVRKLKDKIGEEAVKENLGWVNIEALTRVGRYERMGIKNDNDLRSALTEYLMYRSGTNKADPIKEAERAIIGKKVGVDFFPTPKTLAAQMSELAGVKPGMRVLEPSAGNGNLADAARDAGAQVDTIEISSQLRDILQAKGHNIVDHDFESHAAPELYDAVIMNPPFSDRKDAQHIMRAWDMVKPGGRLVAIAGEGVFFGSDKRASEFRDWLEKNDADIDELPDNTFKDSGLLATTGANARLIVMEKPHKKSAVELAEDRQDLADEMTRNPHSDSAKKMIKQIAEGMA